MSEHPPVACPAVCTTRARKFRQISIERKTKASFTINAILYYLGKALPLLVTFNKKRERERAATQRDQGHAKASLDPGTVVTIRASFERNLCPYSLPTRYLDAHESPRTTEGRKG